MKFRSKPVRTIAFISYHLPRPNKEAIKEYISKDVKLTYKKKRFKKDKTIFALVGRSTVNNGELYKVTGEKEILLDSTQSNYGEPILLKLDPIKRGSYKIKAWGCRYGKEFEILIK